MRPASTDQTSVLPASVNANSGEPLSTRAPRAASPQRWGACSATALGADGSGEPARSAPDQRAATFEAAVIRAGASAVINPGASAVINPGAPPVFSPGALAAIS